jgi:hypothetical protein
VVKTANVVGYTVRKWLVQHSTESNMNDINEQDHILVTSDLTAKKRPRTRVVKIALNPDDFLHISTLNLLQNKHFHGVSPGFSLIPNYHYYHVETNYPITQDDVEMVANSVDGVVERRWLDSYRAMFGITKSSLIDEQTTINEVRDLIQKIISVPVAGSECQCIDCIESSLADIMAESVHDVLEAIRDQNLEVKPEREFLNVSVA